MAGGRPNDDRKWGFWNADRENTYRGILKNLGSQFKSQNRGTYFLKGPISNIGNNVKI